MQPSLKIVAVLALLATAQANAHGLWTEERRGNIEVVYGHGSEDSAFDAVKVKQAWAYDLAGRMIPLTLQRLADHVRLQPLSPPAVLAVALDNGAWSQTADKQWVNQAPSQVKNVIASTHSFKYSLAIYREGARLPKLEQLRLAIVPQGDPLKVGVGNELEVQVLVDGKPAADIELYGDYRGMPHEVSGKTDKSGHARIKVRNEGLNIIAAKTSLAQPKGSAVDKLSVFSSLTFLGEAHHE